MTTVHHATHPTLQVRPPKDLATALQAISDSDLVRLGEAVAHEAQQRRQWTPATLFKPLRTAVMLALLALPLVGCSGFVTDYKILEAYAKSPTVEYADPDRWACEIVKGTTTRGAVEDCGRCRNASATAQGVTINGEAHVAQPGQSVMRCSDNARLMTMDPLPLKPPSPTSTRR